VERTGRKERFARLIQRPVRDLGGPAARAACGGNLNLPYCHAPWSRMIRVDPHVA
jgi:hypothetical protein